MHLKALSPVVIALGLLATTRSEATVLWKGDFETGDLKQWDSTNLIKTGDRDNLVIESDTVAEGTKAAKITLRPDVIFEPYNQSRVEVKHIGLHTMNGEQSYYAWSFMVPKDAEIRSNIGYWESTVTSKNTMTFFIEPAQGGGSNVKFGTGDLGATVRWTAKLELNKWHRMAIHNTWSQDAAVGKVDVWYDGTQVVTAAAVAKRDENKLFFQMGLHRSDPAPPVQDIYLDAAIEADSQEDILMPVTAPMGGSGGMGGAAGMGGVGGLAGSAAGAGGSSGGTGGDTTASGGMPLGGASGAPGSAGTAIATAGTAVTTAGSASTPVTPTGATDDSSSCSVRSMSSRDSAYAAWPLLGLLLLGARRRATREASRAD